MRATKCDRCGKLYEGTTVSELQVTEYRNPYGKKKWDLCPACNRLLGIFLFGQKEKDHEVKKL